MPPFAVVSFAEASLFSRSSATPVHVAQSCYSVIGDKPFLWSKPNFVLPGPIITKLGMIDYVGDFYHMLILVEFGSV